MLNGFAVLFISLSSLATTGTDRSPEYKEITRETKFKWVSDAISEADSGVLLVFKEAKRDKVAKSLVTVKFVVISTRKMIIGGYDPTVRLYLGLSGQRLLKQNYRSTWKMAGFREREHVVSMTVYNSDPKALTLDKLTLNLYFMQLGKGRDETEATFEFKSLPLTD